MHVIQLTGLLAPRSPQLIMVAVSGLGGKSCPRSLSKLSLCSEGSRVSAAAIASENEVVLGGMVADGGRRSVWKECENKFSSRCL